MPVNIVSKGTVRPAICVRREFDAQVGVKKKIIGKKRRLHHALIGIYGFIAPFEVLYHIATYTCIGYAWNKTTPKRLL